MPRINERAEVISGTGGPVSVNGRIIADRGTCAQWWDRDTAIYQTEENGWHLELQNIRTGKKLPLSGACNFLAAQSPNWAAWGPGGLFGTIQAPATGGLSPTGTDQRGAIAPDGTIGLKANYQSNGPVELVPPGRAVGSQFNVSIYPSPYGLCILDAQCAVWNGGGSIGFDTPPKFLPGAIGIRHARVGADDWWCYWVNGIGLVVHRTGYLGDGRLLTQQDAFHHDLTFCDNGRLMVCWSTDIGESPFGYVLKDVLANPGVDLTKLVPREQIIPINRPHGLLWFEHSFAGQPGPGNGYIEVLPNGDGLLTWNDGTRFGHYTNAELEGNSVAAFEMKIAAAKQRDPRLPVGVYWPRACFGQELPPSAKWIFVELYQHTNESNDEFERLAIRELNRIGTKAQACWQCYTSNARNVTELTHLVPIASRILRQCSWIDLSTVFSNRGRSNSGLAGHPEVRPFWQELANSIPSRPTIVVEDDVKAPKVSIKDPIPAFSASGFKLVVDDPNNNQQFTVSTENGSWHVELKNSAGSDKSGKVRPVVIKQ